MANKKIKDKSIKIEFKGNELYHLKQFLQEFRDVLIKTENFKKPFNKACFKAMIGNRDLTFKLRDMAEVSGRTMVYNWVDEVVDKK